VAVGIVNGKGVVVRHLAGGMLGPKAPAPLTAGTLAQTLHWDRKDDRGRPVPAGAYAVQVRAGMRPTFERTIGYDPRALGCVRGLAIGAEGELFVLNGPGLKGGEWQRYDIPVFTRELRYLRTILPVPGDLPLERVRGIRPVTRPDGTYVPRQFTMKSQRSYPHPYGVRQSMLVTPAGDLLLASKGNSLLRIRAADGAVPYALKRVEFVKDAEYGRYAGGMPQLALSADRRWVYAAGIAVTYTDSDFIHAVYRWRLGSDAPPEVFAGEPRKPGNDAGHFWIPRGVTVDGEGNVLVSDWGNNRIVVLSTEGKHIRQFAAKGPGYLCVHRKHGTIYYISTAHEYRFPPAKPLRVKGRMWKRKDLVKIRSSAEPETLGRISLNSRGYYYSRPVLALDDGVDPPIVWIGEHEKGALSRIIDRDPTGGLPAPQVVMSGGRCPEALPSCEHLAVDPATERLYVRGYMRHYGTMGVWRAFDGHTGKPVPIKTIQGAEVRVGPDGALYSYLSAYYDRTAKRAGAWVLRWDRDGKPLPFEGTESHRSESLPHEFTEKELAGGRLATFVDRCGVHGLGVAPDGRIYVIYSSRDRTSNPLWLCVMGRDGKVAEKRLVALTPAGCSPQVDRDGNIYVLDSAVPKGVPGMPAFLNEAITQRELRRVYDGVFGSLIKFPPAGGGIYTRAGTAWGSRSGTVPQTLKGQRTECRRGRVVDNAVWIRPYAASVPSLAGVCICKMARFSLDRYGRAFVPAAPARRIWVVDTEGNRLCVFGRYGNADNGGADSLRPVAGVPMNYGGNVAVSDRAVYIADTHNRRVVKVRLDYRATATCPVP
jgi:hypothetical protein